MLISIIRNCLIVPFFIISSVGFSQNEPDDFVVLKGDTIFSETPFYKIDKYFYQSGKIRKWYLTTDSILIKKTFYENGNIEAVAYKDKDYSDSTYYVELFLQNGKSSGFKKKNLSSREEFQMESNQTLNIDYHGGVVKFNFSEARIRYELSTDTLYDKMAKEQLYFTYQFLAESNELIRDTVSTKFGINTITKDSTSWIGLSGDQRIIIGNIEFTWGYSSSNNIYIFPKCDYKFSLE